MEQIKIDIVPVGVAPVAHASQFDNGRQIRFNLFNQGTPYTLTGAETVTMVVNGEEENITNTSDNYVIWDVAEEDCAEAGVIGCEIRIVLGSMLIGSKNFFLEVEMDPYNGKNIRTITVGPADICTFETTLPEPLQSVLVNVLATGGNGTPDNPNPINGYTEANIVNTQNDSIVDLFSIDSGFRGTVDFNQLVQNGNFEDTSIWTVTSGTTFTVNNNVGHAEFTTNYKYVEQVVSAIVGHKYLIMSDIRALQGALNIILGTTPQITISDSNWNTYYKMLSATNNTLEIDVLRRTTSDNIVIGEAKNCICVDLTQMFGATIADYIYSLEQNNAGAGVAFFRSIYPEDYYSYDLGTKEIVGKETPEAVIAFGQTVYGGQLIILPDRTYFHATYGYVPDMSAYNFVKELSGGKYHYYSGQIPNAKQFDFYTLSDTLCSSYPTVTRQALYAGTLGCAFDNTSRFYVYNPDYDNESTTAADVINDMSGVSVAYELATPFDIDLTPEVISAIVGTNNVFAGCGQTEVKYLAEG